MNTQVKMNFNTRVAKDVGTDAAIILSNLAYWVFVNKHNDRNFHDGKYWSYNSVNAFSKIFSWLSKNQIKRCLTKLEDRGYIVSGNYNKSAYDRTKWYTVNDLTHCYKSTNGRDQTDQPIPYSKPNNKPNSNSGEFSIENTNPPTSQLDLPLQTEKKGKEKEKDSEQKEKSFKQWSESDFKDNLSVFLDKYGKEMLNAFYLYWSEPMANGKMLLTSKKSWDTARRLNTWSRNNFNKTASHGANNENTYNGR